MKREFKHSYIKMRLHFQKLWKENHEKKNDLRKIDKRNERKYVFSEEKLFTHRS
jgi:hypothetical protein